MSPADTPLPAAQPSPGSSGTGSLRKTGGNPARTNFRRIVPVNALGTFVIASITAAILTAELPLAWLGPWWVAHNLPAVYLLARWLTGGNRQPPRLRRRIRLYDALSAGFAGAVWGAGAAFLPWLAPHSQVLLVTVTAGMIAGSAATLAVLPLAGRLFMGLASGPYIVFFLVQGDPPGIGLAAMCAVFLAAMLIINRIVHGVIRRNKMLFEENAALYARIRAAQAELLNVAESSEAFAFCDGSGRLQVWNRRFPDLIGLDHTALARGDRLEDVLVRYGLPAAELLAQKAAPGAEVKLPNGRWVRARVRDTPHGDHALILIDTTEQQRLFGAVSEARDAALQASQAKSTFLANMSHELRTPLNAIIGFSDIVQQAMFGPGSPKYDEYLRDINASARHLLSIIDDILDLARIEANQIVLRESEIDLAEEIATCARLAASHVGRGVGAVTIDVPNDLPPLNGDARLMRQILLNLLGNALKFSPAAIPVEAGARLDGKDRIEIWVRDHGIGIPKEDQARIFEPFEQVDTQRSRQYGGVGLGLSLVRAFVVAHQGSIAIDSAPGSGTTITATFPESRTGRW